jgi:hypothetical protein
MSAIADIFAAVHLNLETGTFEVDAAKLADSAGATMSSKLSSKLKSAISAGIGALAGAGLSMALTGANQLDDATKQLQADTGMTAAAAKLAEHSIAGMYQNNLQGFDEIGAAMAAVHNDLGLVGAAADAATQQFLTFATASGQNAADAVAAVRGDLDAWNLTAADAGPLMDKLIASHEKFGIVVTADQAALQTLAPAMQAANMSVDDGIALLNLFQTAGISMSRVSLALATAIKQLKPGESLNDLIATLSAIDDPTLRAQAAIKDFGAISGVKLAQAIKPGMTSLADMTASLGDTAGASQKADDAIRSAFGNQAVLLLHDFQGALADMATSLGTSSDAILMAAALLGPKLATGILSGFGAAAGLLVPRLAAMVTADVMPWMTAGTVIGTTISTAATAALVLAVPVAIASVLFLARDEWSKQTASWGLNVPNLFGGQGPFAPKVPIVPVGPQTVYPEGNAAAHQAAMEAVKAASGGLQQGLAAATPQWQKDWQQALTNTFRAGERDPSGNAGRVAAANVAATFGTALVSGVVAAAVHASSAGMAALAQGIDDARNKPVDAFNTMLDMLKTPETAAQEAARLAGGLTSQALKDGLESKDPEIHAQAIAVKRMIVDRLEEIAKEGGTLGKDAMTELVKGMNSKDDDIAYASKVAYDAAMSYLNQAKTDAGAAGEAAGSAFGEGFTVGAGRKLTVGGIHISIGGGGGLAAGGPVTAGMPYIVGDAGRPELFVPETNGYVLPSVPTGAGQTFNFNGPIQLGDAHDEFSLTQQLRFLAGVQG